MSKKSKKSFLLLTLALFSFSLFAFEKPMIINIHTEYAGGNKINIMWTNPENTEKKITKFLVYRNTMPITVFNDINNSTFLAQIPGSSTGYTDTVKDLNDYYYAVLSFTDECYDLIMPSMNATVNGVHVEAKKQAPVIPKREELEKKYPTGTLRETPLPYLDLVDGIEKSENQISGLAYEKAAGLGRKSAAPAVLLEPYYFEADMISPERGDAYYLFQILSQSFAPRKYPDSIVQLKKLTGTNITPEVENRATFYLGEAYYFTGDFENAVRTFVKVQEYFPEESKKWLESSLDHLEIN